MCGISGIISKEKINLGKKLADMNNLAKHRGPDDEGYVLLDSKNKDFICAAGNDTPQDSWNTVTGYQPSINIHSTNQLVNLGLGHRRLSILDLSPFGHLPMCDNSSQY
jgi:asparagine synthase (glutamine-hydrolysing)